jgi:hypothetical protein
LVYLKVTELSDPELSKTAFERTLLMEERSKMLKQMQRRGVASRLAQINGGINAGEDSRIPATVKIKNELI